MIDHIQIRGARVHNLKHVDVDVPLNQIVGIAGAVRLREVLAGAGGAVCGGLPGGIWMPLSTYTRRRMTGRRRKAQVDEVLYVPAALALHQRPGVPGHPRAPSGRARSC